MMSHVLEINLTAPEVHPPQRILMFEGCSAYLYGVGGEGENAVILASWRDDDRENLVGKAPGGQSFDAEHDPEQWRWYLGWAFADIAREAERVENEFYDNLLRWRYAHGI